METSKTSMLNSQITGIYRLLIVVSVLAALYLAKGIIIPIAIAALLAFLLSPLVTYIERWLGTILSVLVVVVVVFSLIGLAGYIFTKQLIAFGSNFPSYYEIILVKLKSIAIPDFLERIVQALGNIKERLFQNTTDANIPPIETKLMELSSTLTSFAESFFGSFVYALGSGALVILLVIFMLLSRDDIRSRIVKLMGEGRISSATNVMDDASERLFRYLFRQFIVNICFGMVLATGLYLIGIPNAILWGCLAFVLRFIPYIGPPVLASFPIILSLILADSWTLPLATISFIVLLEIITAYFIEPFYYGVGTGVSAFALIMSAIFWTWLWGPVGLLLATPMTVCLAVIGQYLPNMSFLRVLLSKEEAMTSLEQCYYNLLSSDSNAALEVVEKYPPLEFYDTLLIPIITQTEVDLHLGLIDQERKENVYQGVQEIIEFIGLQEQKKAQEPKGSVLCVPAHTMRDELGVQILSQMLARDSFEVHYTTKLHLNDIFELMRKRKPDAVCIVAVAPFVLSHLRFLCNRLHQEMPETALVVSVLGGKEVLKSDGSFKVAASLQETVRVLNE